MALVTGTRKCNVCQGEKFNVLSDRIDHARVLRCDHCDMGVVDPTPAQTEGFYGDEYYGGAAHREGVGYGDYLFTAEHGVSWAAAFVQLLKDGGKALDIGCVDGYLLRKLTGPFELFGIEVNKQMARRASSHGIVILGNDLLDPKLRETQRGSFDVVTSIAVFEHLTDLRGGMEIALDLLKDDGVLLFEVPLISEKHDNEMWFRSSLEHIFYPSERSLRYLVEEELKHYLIGGECVVRDYASTYVGVVIKCAANGERIRALYQRLTGAEEPLSTAERAARLQLLLVHCASTSIETVGDLACLPRQAFTTALRKRLQQLWTEDLRALSSLRASTPELIKARDYHATQASNFEAEASRLRAEHGELIEARDYYAAQARNFEAERGRLAAAHEGLARDYDQTAARLAAAAADNELLRVRVVVGEAQAERARAEMLLSGAERDRAEARLVLASTESERLKADVAAARSALEELRHQLNQQLATAAEERQGLQRRFDQQLRAAADEPHRLAEALRRSTAEIARLQRELALAEIERRRTVAAALADAQALCAASAAAELNLGVLMNSTAWKLTYPARRVAARYPSLARTLRRALKLAWWSLRLQLFSKLREWRQLHRRVE